MRDGERERMASGKESARIRGQKGGTERKWERRKKREGVDKTIARDGREKGGECGGK